MLNGKKWSLKLHAIAILGYLIKPLFILHHLQDENNEAA